ncbi:MAG TPA: phosphoribosyltransferase family protein [Nitrososphaera sp.]|jgi:predicted phosphoribosyltransferase
MGFMQLRFADRKAAGDILAELLWQSIPEAHKQDVTILGIPRGGAVIAKQVSVKFSTKPELVVAKKILAPGSDEDAIGAIAPGEPEYLDSRLLVRMNIDPNDINAMIAQTRQEVAFRQELYLGKSESIPRITGKTVVLVDDGAATGATLIASARFVKKRNPSLLVIGVPVATKSSKALLEKEADKLVTIVEAKEKFRAVGQFYKSFIPISHEDVLDIIGNTRAQHSK